MKTSPKLFISFSSIDKIIAKKMFYRLKSLNADIWDYSQTGSGIGWGKSIPEVLKQRIDKADFMIVIMSENTISPKSGYYTSLEVNYAIDKEYHKQGRILPIVLKRSSIFDMRKHFPAIEERLYYELDPNNNIEFEELIEKITRHMGLQYLPPFLAHKNLPISSKFQEEIKSWNDDVTIADNSELMLILNRFADYYRKQDYLNAEKTIIYFLLTCKYKISKFKPYYPLIVKGVCEIHLGKFLEAEETFYEALKNDLRDENAYGGLGQVYFIQNRYEEALSAYNEALKLCPPKLNIEILFNITGTNLNLGINAKSYRVFHDILKKELSPAERRNAINMHAIALYNNGCKDEASTMLKELISKGNFDSVTVIYLYKILTELKKSAEALLLLEREAIRFNDVIIWHYLAHAYWHLFRDKDAINIFENKIIIIQPRNRQYLIEYARLLKLNNPAKMKQICIEMLERGIKSKPQSDKDYYYEGYGNYLIGRFERARYDYERSNEYSLYYDKILD